MDGLINFFENHYIAASLLALLAVYASIMIYSLTGGKALLKTATLQYIFIGVLVISTPIILWILKR